MSRLLPSKCNYCKWPEHQAYGLEYCPKNTQAVVKDLTDGKHITDCEKAIGWTVLGLLGAVAAGAAYYMLKPNDKNDKK